MQANIDTNILVQYIVKTDKKSVEIIADYIKKYDKFVVTQPIFMESVFVLENKLGLSRDDIDREFFCLMEDFLFEFVLDFDIYLFLNLYTNYHSLDIVDIYLLIHSKQVNMLTLDMDLSKKIQSITL